MTRFVFAVFSFALIQASALAQTNSTLTIETGDAQAHVLNIELADTPEAIERGLMERESLDPQAGMLFDFDPPRDAMMWMKNTPLPLDVLFINDRGRVIAIARNTVPQSERRIGTGARVRAVLEINAGRANALNIAPGATVRHSLFGNETAALSEAE